MTYGYLTVISEELVTINGKLQVDWTCRCACGREISVDCWSVKRGHKRSCGHVECKYRTEMNRIDRSRMLAGIREKLWGALQEAREPLPAFKLARMANPDHALHSMIVFLKLWARRGMIKETFVCDASGKMQSLYQKKGGTGEAATQRHAASGLYAVDDAQQTQPDQSGRRQQGQ